MLMITSTLGATDKYPDKSMMETTLLAFLRSVDRQTCRNFRVFLACHDVPVGVPYYPWLEWCSVSVDGSTEQTWTWESLPKNVDDSGVSVAKSYGQKITDMSRKTFHASVMAGRYAAKAGLSEFWTLRMDSDDLLARDVVAMIEQLDRTGVEAVWSRKAHMFDVKERKIGEYKFNGSLTCNAIKMKFLGRALPRWFYHCDDHTNFARRVRMDHIKNVERDFTLCVLTNSGNSISGRPDIRREQCARVITLHSELVEKYGLGPLL
jgi:hypothetical protein